MTVMWAVVWAVTVMWAWLWDASVAGDGAGGVDVGGGGVVNKNDEGLDTRDVDGTLDVYISPSSTTSV
mgnify:CR=1 FL=1